MFLPYVPSWTQLLGASSTALRGIEAVLYNERTLRAAEIAKDLFLVGSFFGQDTKGKTAKQKLENLKKQGQLYDKKLNKQEISYNRRERTFTQNYGFSKWDKRSKSSKLLRASKFDPGLIALKEVQLLKSQREVKRAFNQYLTDFNMADGDLRIIHPNTSTPILLIPRIGIGTAYNGRIGRIVTIKELKFIVYLENYVWNPTLGEEDGDWEKVAFDGDVRLSIYKINGLKSSSVWEEEEYDVPCIKDIDLSAIFRSYSGTSGINYMLNIDRKLPAKEIKVVNNKIWRLKDMENDVNHLENFWTTKKTQKLSFDMKDELLKEDLKNFAFPDCYGIGVAYNYSMSGLPETYKRKLRLVIICDISFIDS